MKKLFAVLAVMMMVSSQAWAMSGRPDMKQYQCLQKTNDCWVQDPTSSMGKTLESACVTKVYCDCYTEFKNPLAARYCA